MAEVKPGSEPATATIHTNSGAGEGMGRRRSSRIASSAIAAVSAGPEIARHPNRMGLSRSSRTSKAPTLTDHRANAMRFRAVRLRRTCARAQNFRLILDQVRELQAVLQHGRV